MWVLALVSWSGCQSFPPALTGMTIAPSNAEGLPVGDSMYRTHAGPPIPLIAVRSGGDPNTGGLMLNQPSGDIAVTLARGVQSFLLLTTLETATPYFVIALFLDQEQTPALSAVVSGDGSRPLAASRAPMLTGLTGEPVPNQSSLSVLHAGYTIALRRAAFPLPARALDLVGPWRLVPDGINDTLGSITIEVQPAGGRPGA